MNYCVLNVFYSCLPHLYKQPITSRLHTVPCCHWSTRAALPTLPCLVILFNHRHYIGNTASRLLMVNIGNAAITLAPPLPSPPWQHCSLTLICNEHWQHCNNTQIKHENIGNRKKKKIIVFFKLHDFKGKKNICKENQTNTQTHTHTNTQTHTHTNKHTNKHKLIQHLITLRFFLFIY